MSRRVAVVIGVAETQGFATLPGARKGATAFATWAATAGFEVHRFIDDGQLVTIGPILDAVRRHTDGTVSQLIVYFSGHGLAAGLDRDFWVLSGGVHDNPNDVINVRTSLEYARAYSSIPHVIVYADACRTIAGIRHAPGAQGGGVIFPGKPIVSLATTVDVFYATKSGEVAAELVATATAAEAADAQIVGTHGFFTDVLLPALRGDVADVLRDNPDSGATVLYAQQLATYVSKEVPMVSGRATLASQYADPRPSSSHPLFLIELKAPQHATLTVSARLPDGSAATTADVAILDIDRDNPMLTQRLKTSGKGTVSAPLPQHRYYGTSATLAGHLQAPPNPNPMVYLFGDQTQNVDLVASAIAPTDTAPAPAPSLSETYVVDGHGVQHATPPVDGVFSVVSRDVLSGRTASELHRLEAGAQPALHHPLEADSTTEGPIDAEAGLHAEARETRDRFETEMGLSLIGAEVYEAATAGRAEIESVDGAGRRIWHVRAHEAGSAIVTLDDDRHAALAIFPGFIGSATIGPLGVYGLSYAPTANSALYPGIEEPAELLRVRSMAEAVARSNRLDLMRSDARPFARALRVYKHVDPVLGILAAYAYHEIGELGRIEDMISAFVEAGQFVPFDLVMLAGADHGDYAGCMAPAYPLLTQGWSLLGDDEEIGWVLAEARRSLAATLWATVTGCAGVVLAATVGTRELA